jgi:superfamily II DNA/RNA helicase
MTSLSSALAARPVAARAHPSAGRGTRAQPSGRSRFNARARPPFPGEGPRVRGVPRAIGDDFVPGDEVAAPTGLGLSDAEEVVLLSSEDENVLTTALSRAIAVEDYELAGKLSARLKKLQGVGDELGAEILDWRALGMAEWLCDRAENLGFRYPTAVQRRASLAFFKKRDVVIQAQTGSGKTLAYLMPTIDNLDFVARKMLQVLIIVPSRELTIQTVMLAYRLFGGNVNVGVPGASDNMFNYKGPQGIKVVGVFEEDHETREGFADVAEIVVGTPDALARMKNAGFLEVDLAQTIVADEADQLFEQFPEAMETLLAPSPYAPVMEDRQVVLCGVSVPDSVVQLVQQRGHFKQNPLSIQMGTPGRVPPSVKHRRLVTPRARKLVALARQIRADLAFAGEDAPPPRTIVFVPSAVAAEAAAGPLRKSLWGKHKLAVLLPDGKEAVRVMQDFKNQKTTLLLCTPDVERGLDMPGVDYIYSLDAPSLSASYLHRAGRCGRLGATTTGVVTSVVTPEEASALDQTMGELEIPSWETLEEQVNEPSVGKERGADSAESANDETDDSERYSSSSPIEEEERALTAAALNDLFYLVDAQADAVNALEAVFASGDAAASWDEDEEDDPEDLASQRRLDEIRKLFEIVDERDLDDEDGKGK